MNTRGARVAYAKYLEPGIRSRSRLPLRLPQHPDEHRPEGPILLAVDRQLREGSALQVAPELADPVGPLEVGEHQDVEEFGAGSWAEGVETLM
jgi:hypothetical protein